MEFIKKTFFSSYPRIAGFLAVAMLILSIPISLSLVKQKQNVRQSAYAQSCSQTYGGMSCTGCGSYVDIYYNYGGTCGNTQYVPCTSQACINACSSCGACAPGQGQCSAAPTATPVPQAPTPTPNLCPTGGKPIQCGGSAIICCPTSTDTCLYKTTLGYCCGSVCGNVSANPTSTPIPTPTPNPNIPTPTPFPQDYYAHCEMCPGNTQCGTKAYQTCNACGYALVWLYNCYGGTVSSTRFVADSTCNSQALCLPTNGPTPTPVRLFNTPTPAQGSATPTPTKAAGATPTTASKLTCDPFIDGKINIQDYSEFVSQFTGAKPAGTADCDKSGRVDIVDYSILIKEFLDPAVPH